MRVPVTLAGRYNEIAETFHRRCFCEHRNRMIWVFAPPGSIREGILTIDGANVIEKGGSGTPTEFGVQGNIGSDGSECVVTKSADKPVAVNHMQRPIVVFID